ncbi:unnamed protein product [Hyaloperonospora brassicae]|uniref:Uncharacterized protein n=1 Tax=Hyaloperonospora brassicae TaxID=162125 RepID=A0AAV0U2C8_HYABA|nr:unnamed protein product [Hyaloperonospora brassicae]
MTAAHDAAEAQKTLGNEEFNAKNFDKAVECYSEAIRLNPDNYVYYSNRSAAYGAVNKWALAEQDAQECVKRQPEFAKGYHRLANAQQQLGRQQEAIETLQTAQSLARDPDKVPGIKKLLRQLQQEVAPKSASLRTDGRHCQVPGHIAKELRELQPHFQQIERELEQVDRKLAASVRQKKRLALVEHEVAALPEATRTFRSIGKLFVQATRDESAASIKGEEEQVDAHVSSLEARKQYLTRQKQLVQDNLTELLAQCT